MKTKMETQIKLHLPLLEYIMGLSPEKRSGFLKVLKNKNIEFIFDLLLNLDRNRLPITKEIVSKLLPYSKVIHSLIKPKKSLIRRRRELIEKDYFHLLISPLIPVLHRMIQ